MNAIIYHKNCLDGWMSAYLTILLLGDKPYKLYPMLYNDTIPKIEDNDIVYVVDFSLTMEQLLDLASKNKSVSLFDHHAAAFKCLVDIYKDYKIEDIPNNAWYAFDQNNLCIHLDMSNSGAMIMWRELSKSMESRKHAVYNDRLERLAKAVSDRDLWNFNIPDTEVLCQVLDSQPWTKESFDYIWQCERTLFGEMVAKAEATVSMMHEYASKQAKTATVIRFDGMDIPVANCTSLISLTNEKMYNDVNGPVSMTYAINGTVDVIVSMRSSRASGISVGDICVKHGGGGHKHSAGFRLPIYALEHLLRGDL